MKANFAVDEHVPLPSDAMDEVANKAKRKNRPKGYPWGQMKPGDSFFVPLQGSAFNNLQDLFNSIRNTANAVKYAKAGGGYNWSYVCRKDPINSGVRVWRAL